VAGPQHIKAKAGDVSERVVVSGDPARVIQLSKSLSDAKLINENRGFITYTGSFEGCRLTVACHGVGAPSAAVVIEELVMLGARSVVRLGTCGGLVKDMKIGDVVIPTGAAYIGGTLQQYVPGDRITPVPSFDLTQSLVNSVKEEGVKYFLGPVFSSDAFHAEDPDFVSKWTSRGYIAVEMECATLFGLGMLRHVKTASALLVSDNLVEMEPMVDASQLREHVDRCSRAVFRAICGTPV
jgi:5'-methylthioadenosine phosphorylase